MVQDKELEKLRKELAAGEARVKKEEEKANIEAQKSQLRRKLILLKNPKKVAFARKIKTGLKATGKVIGKGILKQGRLIAAQQERDARLESAREKQFGKIPKARKSKKGKKRSIPASSLNLSVGGRKVKQLKKKAKLKTPKRKKRKLKAQDGFDLLGSFDL